MIQCRAPRVSKGRRANRFVPRCSTKTFTQEEIDILERYGKQFAKLMHGKRSPQTIAQERFVRVAQGKCEPSTIYEKTWRKYLERLIREDDPEHQAIMGERRQMPNDREDHKKMRGAVWSEVRRRSKGLD